VIYEILSDPKYRDRAAAIGAQVQEEHGVKQAGDALEALVLRAQSKEIAVS
jgi:UDP:flavonoid glycosyltransferase YjiC (YdhE family)